MSAVPAIADVRAVALERQKMTLCRHRRSAQGGRKPAVDRAAGKAAPDRCKGRLNSPFWHASDGGGRNPPAKPFPELLRQGGIMAMIIGSVCVCAEETESTPIAPSQVGRSVSYVIYVWKGDPLAPRPGLFGLHQGSLRAISGMMVGMKKPKAKKRAQRALEFPFYPVLFALFIPVDTLARNIAVFTPSDATR